MTRKRHDYETMGCRNCGTHRYEERSAGYCQRCAYKADKYRRLIAGTWKGRGRYPELHRDARLHVIWETELALQDLRLLEEPLLRDSIDPQQIADLLYSIVNATRAMPKAWSNLGTRFFNQVPADRNPDVYRFLYLTLLELVETLPQRRYRQSSTTLWWWLNHRDYPDFEIFKEWRDKFLKAHAVSPAPPSA